MLAHELGAGRGQLDQVQVGDLDEVQSVVKIPRVLTSHRRRLGEDGPYRGVGNPVTCWVPTAGPLTRARARDYYWCHVAALETIVSHTSRLAGG